MSSLNNINLKGGGNESHVFYTSGLSPSGLIGDNSISVFVKCQIIALWFIIIVIIIMGIIGHKRAMKKPDYKNHNPVSKTLESAAEGFNELFG